MEFKKNQILELYIDDIGNEGEGIGHIDGYALFLKDAVIGDKVRAKIIKTKKNYDMARLGWSGQCRLPVHRDFLG